MFKRDNSQKPVDSEWHEFRANARRTAFSPAEFGDIETEKYDLETAGITGRENPETYLWERPLWPEKRHDVRTDNDK